MVRTRSGSARANGVGASGGGIGQLTPDRQCAAQRHQPVVLLKRPPGEQRERAARAQPAADVRERGDGIVEEHGPEAAHRNVECLGFEREDLGVAADERHVVEAFVGAALAGQLEHPGREVDPCDLAVGGDAGDVARRSAGAAAHVQHAIARPTSSRVDEALPDPTTRPVVAVRLLGPHVALVSVPRGGLLDVDHLDAHSARLRPVCSHREECRYPQREDVNGDASGALVVDDHVVRHPGPPRGQALDDLRARPADAPRPRPVLAAGREQALRGTEEARRPRARPRHQGDDGQAAPHRLLDHRQGSASDGGVGAATRRRSRARVRGAREALLRRARHEAGHPRDTRPRPRVERRPAPRQRRDLAGRTSTARAHSPSACPGSCCAASSSRSSTSWWSAGPSGPRASSRRGPTTSPPPSPRSTCSKPKRDAPRRGPQRPLSSSAVVTPAWMG